MNATLSQPKPARSARRGFPGLRCPLCGTAEDVQSLDLDDLHGLHCAGCGEDYSVDDVRQLMAAWQRVLDWIAAAPLTHVEE